MYRDYDFDHMPWFLIPDQPDVEVSLRRSAKVITWILSLIVLGLLCVAFIPQPGHAKAAAHQAQPQHKVPRPRNQLTPSPLPHRV